VVEPLVDVGWGVADSLTGEPVWVGRWPTEDGAKQMLRRFQRDMNKHGYDPASTRLVTAYFGGSVAVNAKDAGAPSATRDESGNESVSGMSRPGHHY